MDFFWRHYGVIAEADGLLKYDSGQKAIAERRRDRLLHVAARIRDAFARQLRLSRPT